MFYREKGVQKLKIKKRDIRIMKKGILIGLLLLCGSMEIKSQDFYLKKDFVDQTLEEVLKTIETETDYQFSYSSTAIPAKMKITVSVNDSSIEQALERIFSGTSIQYEILENRVILKQNREGQTVRGTVVDRYTQVPIIGAAVVLLDSNPLKGDATDVEGRFRIENVSAGRYTIQVSYLGYKNEIIPGVLVGSGQEVVMDIELEESLLEMEAIQVGTGSISSAPLNDMAQVSGRSFTVEETKRFPVSVGDPLRLASSFAGVLATDDGANDIIVRGNSPRGLLWKLEGVEIPSPNHFSSEGTSSGAISMFSTQVISRSDFLTSAFPAQYGNATSGVFDVGLRNGNNERRESTFQLGLLGVDLASEGPFSKEKGSSYLFNYRYSTLSLLSAVGLPLEEEGEKNIFQDLSFKLNFPTEKAGVFSVFGMGGLSSYEENLTNLENTEGYNMGVIGLSNTYIINNSTVLKSTASLSGTKVYDTYTLPYESTNEVYQEDNTFKKSFLRFSVNMDKKFNAKHVLSSGVTASSLTYDFRSFSKIPQNDPPYNNIEFFDDEGSSGSFQAFTSWKYRPVENLSFVNGVHVLHFFLTQETVVEPRSNLRWQFHPRSAVFAGFGLHSRIESLEYYFANDIQEDGSEIKYNADLGVTRSRHYVVGFDAQVTDKVYFKTELYYQSIFNVPVLSDSVNPNSALAGAFSTINLSDGYITDDLVNGGSGENYGVEMTLERKFSNNYYFLINAMLYESKYKGRDGITRNTRYNGNFGYNLLAGKEFNLGGSQTGRTLGFNLKLTHAGNKRYSPINLEQSRQQGQEVVLAEDVYTTRFQDYFRTDIQLSYRKNLNGRTVEWRLDIQNVTSHNNVLDIYYDTVSEQVIIPEETVFIPVLSYRVEF